MPQEIHVYTFPLTGPAVPAVDAETRRIYAAAGPMDIVQGALADALNLPLVGREKALREINIARGKAATGGRSVAEELASATVRAVIAADGTPLGIGVATFLAYCSRFEWIREQSSGLGVRIGDRCWAAEEGLWTSCPCPVRDD